MSKKPIRKKDYKPVSEEFRYRFSSSYRGQKNTMNEIIFVLLIIAAIFALYKDYL